MSSRATSRSSQKTPQCQPLIPLKTLDNFTLGPLLGKGTYGKVYKVTDNETGQSYALKKISKDGTDEDAIQSEIILLCRLHPHCQPYLLCYEGYFEDATDIYVLTENLEDYQSLSHLIDIDAIGKQKEPPMDLIINLVEGLSSLHGQGIAHRDIKPDNILTKADHIKYIDFGLSCSEECEESIKGTPNYFAPEMHSLMSGGSVQLSIHDYKLFDIWALGATIYELCIGLTPIEAGLDDYLKLSGISNQSLKRMDEFDRIIAEVETFSHYFRFPSKIPHVAKYDQIVIAFDQKLRAYSQQKIGREISVVRMLQVNPTKRSMYA
jgi:serine/threonine protein kinase